MNEKEERILAAGDLLFARHGLRKTTVEEIAKEAGVGKGTVYLYYASKEEIFVAAQRRQTGAALETLRKAIDGEGSAERQLLAFLQARFALFDLYARTRPINLDLFAESQSQPEYKLVNGEYEQAEAALVRGILDAGLARGEFHVADVDAALWVIQQAMIGVTMSLFIRRETTSDLPSRVAALHQVLVGGIKNRK